MGMSVCNKASAELKEFEKKLRKVRKVPYLFQWVL